MTFAGDTGTPVPDVNVTVRSLGGGPAVRITTTASNGEFLFQGLAPGWYQVETCREGLNSMIVPVLVQADAPDDAAIEMPMGLSA